MTPSCARMPRASSASGCRASTSCCATTSAGMTHGDAHAARVRGVSRRRLPRDARTARRRRGARHRPRRQRIGRSASSCSRHCELDCILLAGRYTLLEQPALRDAPAAVRANAACPSSAAVRSTPEFSPPARAPARRRTTTTPRRRPPCSSACARLEELCADFSVPLQAAALQFPLAHPRGRERGGRMRQRRRSAQLRRHVLPSDTAPRSGARCANAGSSTRARRCPHECPHEPRRQPPALLAPGSRRLRLADAGARAHLPRLSCRSTSSRSWRTPASARRSSCRRRPPSPKRASCWSWRASMPSSPASWAGWISRAPKLPDTIAALAADPRLVGLRPMIQDIPDTEWMLEPKLAPAFEAMIDHGLVFDALVLPKHLPALLELAARYPDLRHGAGSRRQAAASPPAILRTGSRDHRTRALVAHASANSPGLVTEAGSADAAVLAASRRSPAREFRPARD